jgi:Diguanylate cyclase, GGDEF domain
LKHWVQPGLRRRVDVRARAQVASNSTAPFVLIHFLAGCWRWLRNSWDHRPAVREDAPQPVHSLEAFQRRAGATVLLFFAACAGVLSVIGVGQWAGIIPGMLVHGVRDSHRVTLANTVAVLVTLGLYRLHTRSNGDWAIRALTLTLVALIIPVIPPASFAGGGAPQAIWIPTLIAFALTGLRWALFTTVASIGSVVFFHANHGAFASPTSLVVTAVLVVSIAAPRLVYDRTYAAQRALARSAEHLALHDALTGLANRRLLADRLDVAIRHAERARAGLAVLFVDLDHFGDVNLRGHSSGDRLIVDAARARGVRARDRHRRAARERRVRHRAGTAGRSRCRRASGRRRA